MSKSPENVRLLVVDDEPFVADLVATRLRMAGFYVGTARDGFLALTALRELEPHAAIIDLNMPNMDGFGLLQRLRELPRFRAMPAMVLTARNSPDDVRKALSLGARDYLAKPFDDRMLLKRVNRLLQQIRPAVQTA